MLGKNESLNDQSLYIRVVGKAQKRNHDKMKEGIKSIEAIGPRGYWRWLSGIHVMSQMVDSFFLCVSWVIFGYHKRRDLDGTWTGERICEYIILMDVFFVWKRNFNLVKNWGVQTSWSSVRDWTPFYVFATIRWLYYHHHRLFLDSVATLIWAASAAAEAICEGSSPSIHGIHEAHLLSCLLPKSGQSHSVVAFVDWLQEGH